jgi:methylamine utilization protein MauE
VIDLFARALLVVVFAGAVAGKLRSGRAFAEFHDSVSALAPRWLSARPVAIMVLAGEAACVVLLVVPVTHLAGYALSGLLLAAFAAAVVRVIHSGRQVRCHCFGGGGGVLGRGHVVRNGLLLAAAGAGALGGATVTAPVALVAMAAGALAGLITVRWEDVAFLLGPPVPAGRNR